MALSKPITLENGITVSYHRILYVTTTVNKQTSISVLSYINYGSRQSELENQSEPYRIGRTYEVEYDEHMTVEKAYERLKQLDEFKDSENV
jgi:hypothetical protein